jgi:hypothetical protein
MKGESSGESKDESKVESGGNNIISVLAGHFVYELWWCAMPLVATHARARRHTGRWSERRASRQRDRLPSRPKLQMAGS